ncbi:hypothetical protein [Pelagovum pacificum]|uniref:Very short patch repair endonuclease n=1 Tax=Pelagovum pacificum TaxID=2588711 RepID=A0A5C5GDR6_9RHOB|nr:hypothetical protein [Pelagovum pacificum]QQA41461.1 very short patch repair endonuclease [Pelagovum pacificum]TNY31736.1 hypothetical protein FHY64_00075 [Pelagovum pacificum]
MVDIVDAETRSRMMAGLKGENTKPSWLSGRHCTRAVSASDSIRRMVHGRLDLVLPKYRAVVFVHGCFWHRHEGCRYSTTPATRSEFIAGRSEQYRP